MSSAYITSVTPSSSAPLPAQTPIEHPVAVNPIHFKNPSENNVENPFLLRQEEIASPEILRANWQRREDLRGGYPASQSTYRVIDRDRQQSMLSLELCSWGLEWVKITYSFFSLIFVAAHKPAEITIGVAAVLWVACYILESVRQRYQLFPVGIPHTYQGDFYISATRVPYFAKFLWNFSPATYRYLATILPQRFRHVSNTAQTPLSSTSPLLPVSPNSSYASTPRINELPV